MLLTFLWVVAVVSGCSEKPKPQDQFKKYVTNWEKQDFEAMYAQLSEPTQKTISKKDFVERYTNIYSDIEVSKLSVNFKMPKEDEEVKPNEAGEVHFTYDLKMDTMAGPVEFSQEAVLVKEERDEKENWYVKWDPSMIFPELKEGDKVGLSTLKAKRGEIYDRNGNGLAINGTVPEIGLVPQELGDQAADTKKKVADALGISVEQIDKSLNASWVQPHFYVPISKLSPEQSAVASELSLLPGVYKKDVAARVYPYSKALAHLIGYVRKVTAEDLEKHKGEGYGANDVIGARGLESLLEERLKGENGGVIYIESKDGKEKTTVAETAAVDGERIELTIDADMQKAIFAQYNGDVGTAAAIDPKTGEVLALVSSPSFDPNKFITGWGDGEYQALQDDPKNPFLNRFSATFAPGSTFKPITAAIGLATGAIDPAATMDVKDDTWQKDKSWGDYYVRRVPGPNRPINLKDALVYSDNIYFAQAALRIGGEKFLSEAKKFGFGEDLPLEYGLKQSKIVSDGKFGSEVLLADSGYGQGQVSVTALHLGLAYTPLVNNGSIPDPYLIKGEKQATWKEAVISPEHAKIILDDLIQVIEDPNGTGHDANLAIPLAGKTGTAELKTDKNDKNGKENGWFVAVDTNNPELLVTMMIEDVKERGGSHYVVPKVKKIFEQYVQD